MSFAGHNSPMVLLLSRPQLILHNPHSIDFAQTFRFLFSLFSCSCSIVLPGALCGSFHFVAVVRWSHSLTDIFIHQSVVAIGRAAKQFAANERTNEKLLKYCIQFQLRANNQFERCHWKCCCSKWNFCAPRIKRIKAKIEFVHFIISLANILRVAMLHAACAAYRKLKNDGQRNLCSDKHSNEMHSFILIQTESVRSFEHR